MFKGCPKKGDRPFCLPGVCLGALFSDSSALHHFTSSLQSWLSFLCCETFFERRTLQAWINDPRNGNEGFRQLCHVSANSSGMRACFLGLHVPSYHSCPVNHIHLFPQWDGTQKTSKLFLQTSSYGLFPVQRGMVRFGQGSLYEQKFYCVPWLGLQGKNIDLIISGLNLPKCP